MTGTVELLPAGAVGVDYSFGRPALADMLTLGVQFASRYICIDNPLTHDKLVTPDEIKRLADAGILMMINYEQGESTTLGGDTAGRKHGKVAADWRHYLQMPPELPIVISTDIGVTSAQYPAISDFCAAFQQESGGPIGHYHGTTLCAHLESQGLNDLTWMAMATSWSPGGETAAVHVRQKGYVLGSCDANYVRKDTPFWNFNGTAPDPKIKPWSDDMPVIFRTDDAIHWPGSPTLAGGDYAAGTFITFTLTDGGKVRHLPGMETQLYLRRSIPITVIAGMELKQMIDDGGGVYTGTSSGGGLTAEDVKHIIDSTFLTTG